MAVEGTRGCGFRTVGGLYLVGGTLWDTCDRLPLEIPVCSTCGETLRPNRGIQPINAIKLFNNHNAELAESWSMDTGETEESVPIKCQDRHTCAVCFPQDPLDSVKDFIIWVGREHYTQDEFTAEAHLMGISRRIPHIPEGLKVGQSVIYLAMRNNINTRAGEDRDGRAIKKNGIFMAYKPQDLELLIWESEATRKYNLELRKRGIVPVVIPDGDEDHRSTRSRHNAILPVTVEEGGEPEEYIPQQHTLEQFFEGL